MIKLGFALLIFFSGIFTVADRAHAEKAGEVPFYTYRIVNTFPHDARSFTQGLFIHDGALYESTGRYGESRLHKVMLDTGEQVQSLPLSDEVFGEGSTIFGGKIFVLTWRSGTGLVVNADTFKPERTFTYKGEGWGLTHDGKQLIMSDGTPKLRFLDPETLAETDSLTVKYNGSPVHQLNELEYVNGEIFANIWKSDAIVRIDPDTGVVIGIIDMRGLLSEQESNNSQDQDNVLNGIAYDPDADRLFVTGKNWPKLFEIELMLRR